MLQKRLIPVLLIKDGKVVQSQNFSHTNIIHAMPTIAIEYFNRWAADEIILLDVSRDPGNRESFHDVVSKMSEKCFVPLTAGGWIRSNDDIRKLLRLGADKVTINTRAVNNPEFITEASEAFGSQCIVVSIDARENDEGDYEVVVDRGRTPTDMDPASWAKQAEELGAGEIYITSIDHDGLRQGYDKPLIRSVTEAVDIPVIAFGGVSEWEHLVEGIELGAEAVAAANTFHYTEQSVKNAKNHLRERNVNVR